MKRLSVLLLVATLAALVGTASADERTIQDPQGDNRGDEGAGRLDIGEIGHLHAMEDGNKLLVHSVDAYEDWSNDDLAEGASLYIRFDTDSDGLEERQLELRRAEDGGVYGIVLKPRNGKRVVVGYARAWRENARNVRVAFPRRYLGKGVTQYRWYVLSIDRKCSTDTGGAVVTCSDRAPDSGSVRHRL